MQIPSELMGRALMFGLLIGSIGLAWLVGVAMGGWQFGNFLRRIELDLAPSEVAPFLDRLKNRLQELGFTPSRNPWEFRQGGTHLEDVGAFVHAKTPKVLNVTIDNSAPTQVRIQVALKYDELIVADTGEGAYRDAVLEYITGTTDSMTLIPNRSFLAVCVLAGAVMAWAAILICEAVGFSSYFHPVLACGSSYTALGGFAIFSIARKRGQATGLACAIVGLIGNASAALTVLALKLSGHL